jgi:hypothetical protein
MVLMGCGVILAFRMQPDSRFELGQAPSDAEISHQGV